MIPKIIHYCWFGGKEKPDNLQKYITGWKEKLPDYQFVEWNESNFDVSRSIPYVKEAYAAKKYAFVSDYVRIYALCQYGGVYLDTDIELLRDFSLLLDQSDVLLCYESKKLLCTAFMATVSSQEVFVSFMNTYRERHFIKEDGTFDTTTINQTLTEHLQGYGIKIEERNHVEEGGIAIYTSDYFSAQDVDHGHPFITENTYTVHRFDCSWGKQLKGFAKVKSVLKYKIIRPFLQTVFGYKTADKIIDRFR